jgi:hypothetical protein
MFGEREREACAHGGRDWQRSEAREKEMRESRESKSSDAAFVVCNAEFRCCRLRVPQSQILRDIKHLLPFDYNIEQVINSWILLAVFIGNDFLRNHPTQVSSHLSSPASRKVYKVPQRPSSAVSASIAPRVPQRACWRGFLLLHSCHQDNDQRIELTDRGCPDYGAVQS